MLTPDRLFRLVNELIFLLLGGLLMWIGATGRIFFDRRSIGWVVLSVAMILWGLRALATPEQWWQRWQNRVRGLSLVLTGVLMVLIAKAPFAWVGSLLIATGFLLVLRGIASAVLALRAR